jgi:spore coat protein A, manganese oxidase
MTFQLDITTDKWLPANQLPIPPKAVKAAPIFDAADHYQIEMSAFKHAFHPKLGSVSVFGYNGQYPGPTIEATSTKPVRVSWFNRLVGTNLNALMKFGVRQGMEEPHMLAKPHNGVHLHGARVPATSDGHPDRFYHPNEGFHAYYPNNQPAATLWYHDHTMDVTRLNVYAGLFGLYFIRDATEAAKLPSGAREIPLVLQDKSFANGGSQLFYTQEPGTPEFVGDYPVVNGKIWPVKTLAPRVYRLRICNGANTRFFRLSLKNEADGTITKLHVIGTEGGFLDQVRSVDELTISPGERYDVLIDLVDTAVGAKLVLCNSHPDITDTLTPEFQELVRFDVQGAKVAGDNKFRPSVVNLPARVDPLLPPNDLVPAAFPAINTEIDNDFPIDLMAVELQSFDPNTLKFRRFVLEEYQLEMPTLAGQLSPTVLINGMDWMSAPAVDIKQDDYEVWEFLNTTPDVHPMHIHLVQFKVLGRRNLNVRVGVSSDPSRPEPKIILGYQAGTAKVEDHEMGWKDTVQCPDGQATRVAMRFDGYPGDYVYHCHILEHEDMGMMYRIRID